MSKEHQLPITVQTIDIGNTPITGTFDRIVSIEMFEHMRNYEKLLRLCSNILSNTGKLFVHIFGHHQYTYTFDTNGNSNWMARHFFENGLMPSKSLFQKFNTDMTIQNKWTVNGTHYQKTSEAWLYNMDQNIHNIRDLFQDTYGQHATKFESYWRIFFMSCAELFGFNQGKEWQVYHYLFKKV